MIACSDAQIIPLSNVFDKIKSLTARFTCADLVGITVPEHTKMLVAEIQGIGAAYPLSREKLSPVLACVKVHLQ